MLDLCGAVSDDSYTTHLGDGVATLRVEQRELLFYEKPDPLGERGTVISHDVHVADALAEFLDTFSIAVFVRTPSLAFDAGVLVAPWVVLSLVERFDGQGVLAR